MKRPLRLQASAPLAATAAAVLSGTVLTVAQPAHAAACVGAPGDPTTKTFKYSDIVAGFSCTQGDVTISFDADDIAAFNAGNAPYTFNPDSVFSWSNPDGADTHSLLYTLSPSANNVGNTTQASIQYTITSAVALGQYSTSFTGQSTGTGTRFHDLAPVNSLQGSGIASAAKASAISPVLNFAPNIFSVKMKSSFNTSDSFIQAFTDQFTQVPGPLPIVGAGVALGFSRRLRKRIKISSQA